MANSISGVNPEVLKWARNQSGYTLEEVAQAFNKEVEIIEGWESGTNLPTYNQLEKLAYQLYKRPLALFFFPEPPIESAPEQSFRTLPDFEIQNLIPDTRHAIREAQAMQFALREINDGNNSSDQIIFRDIQINTGSSIPHSTLAIREYLGIPLDVQTDWKNPDEALKIWRDTVQDKGIFVFKRSFKQEGISGFCLLDAEFPIIYLNNSTAVTRQIFTLFHELAHILLNTNGITKQDDRYINFLSGHERDVEVFCNHFAGEFLVPSHNFEKWLKRSWSGGQIDELVADLANRYKVSREVILRKLLDRGIIDRNFYYAKAEQWVLEYKAKRSGRSGGNYYATQATYLGEKFLRVAFNKYYQRRCTIQQLADYLNVKVKNIPGLEQAMLRKVAVQ
jgi:Zn-dependent peptidase ImmA (M78 family)/transcriptional regulator with XRE-family HTH domain